MSAQTAATQHAVSASQEDVISSIHANAHFEDPIPLTRVEWSTLHRKTFDSLDGDPSCDPESERSVSVAYEISEDRTYCAFELAGSAFANCTGTIVAGGAGFEGITVEDMIALRDGLTSVVERVVAGRLFVPRVDQDEAWRRYRVRRDLRESQQCGEVA